MKTKTVIPPALAEKKTSGKASAKRLIWPSVMVASVILFSFCTLFLALYWDSQNGKKDGENRQAEASDHGKDVPMWVDVDLIRVDGASRRGEKLEAVKDIAVHYVANPGTSAKANRNYFDSEDSETSAHFIVGLEGEIIQCVPLDEKSSATNERNRDTISVEVCHPDTSGEFTPVTRKALIRLLVWLCKEYELSEENLIRHYDVTGKMCPLYYVEHPEAWDELKRDVKDKMNTEL